MIKKILSLKNSVLIIFAAVILSIPLQAQVDNIRAENPVYDFLKRMSVSGFLKNYDDIILPLSREKVIHYLIELDSCKNMTVTDNTLLKRFEEKIKLPDNNKDAVNIFDNFPSEFPGNLIIDRQKHLYYYSDSSVSLFIDPVFESENIFSGTGNNFSSIINFGGTARGSYDNWLGFSVEGTNGIVYGSRNAALWDKRVAQSFTFNHTRLNYFDGTSGYLRLKKGIVNLELGREELLWGNGYIDKTILSDNPQQFDFIKFGIAYKKFRYDFIHGWLVQKPDTIYSDSLVGNIQYKPSKYIAISRLGYRANDRLNLGVSQIIIYSNRPFEAAYLNPFLFWESAQRSMNDLDNSFLELDGGYLVTNGLELSSSIIFDDLNFKYLFHKNGWDRSNNGNEWQLSSMFAWPLMPRGFVLKLEVTQIRPYMFSHPGIGEALTYTNNGYLLGSDMQPNSSRFSVEADYRLSSRIFMKLNYSHTLHGANIYDANGNLVRNVGGNVFENINLYDPEYVTLLDGNRQLTDDIRFNFNYEITYGYYFNLFYRYLSQKMENRYTNDNIIIASFDVSFD